MTLNVSSIELNIILNNEDEVLFSFLAQSLNICIVKPFYHVEMNLISPKKKNN